MGSNRSKSKGNAFENKTLKRLRKIVPFIAKTLGSGNSEEDADLQHFGPFMIECKHWKKITDADIAGWWKELVPQAIAKKKCPVLIYKQNYVVEKVKTFVIAEPYFDEKFAPWLSDEKGTIAVTMDLEEWIDWVSR